MSDETVRELALARAREPERIAEAAAARRRPEVALGEGRTLVVAADHSARGMVGAGRHPGAMADRGDLLERLCLALSRPGVTGVLGAPDILEDLLLLGALDGMSVFGSMNRGGIKGARWEIDDRLTAYDAATLEAMGFEGARCSSASTSRTRRRPPPARRARMPSAAGAAEAGRDSRAVHGARRRRAGHPRAHGRRRREGVDDRRRARADLGVHLAQGPGGRRHGARGGGDRAADAAARRRGRRGPGCDVRALAVCARASERLRPRGRALAAVPARRRRHGSRRRGGRPVPRPRTRIMSGLVRADGELTITPETAGWGFSGLRVLELGPSERRKLDTGG